MRRLLIFLILPIVQSCSDYSVGITNTVSKDSPESFKQPTVVNLNEEISEEVKAFVKSGFYSKEEMFENIIEMFYNETLDQSWLKQEIEKQYQQQASEQIKWENETDFDRLAIVFDRLNASGIIALHNAGYTRQDGEGDTFEIHEQLKAKEIKARGYCFYHGQDMARVVDGENLFLAFGDFESNDQLGIDIGKEVVKRLQQSGFKTEWSGSIEKRIEIIGIKWKKRFGNSSCSNERAIKLLTNKQ